MINDLNMNEIRTAMSKVRGGASSEPARDMILEDFVSTHGFHYPEVYRQSLAGAVKFTNALIASSFGGSAFKFRLDFIRYLTDFENYSDATAATTSYTDLEKFIQYLITYAFDGKNDEYLSALQRFMASKS